MLSPEESRKNLEESNQQAFEIIHDNPWLIPAVFGTMTIPVAIAVHGFWKNRLVKKQLKIERERTKQLAIKNAEPKGPFGLH